jgi:hypothetical protein
MNWNDISTLNFQKYAKTLKEKPESELERVQLLIKQNAILLGVTEDEAKKIPLGELQSVKNLLTTPIPQKIYETFKLNGVWYEVTMNPKELTAERFAGVQEAAKNDDLALAMYYICRPFKPSLLKRKYFEFNESEIPERVKGFNDLTRNDHLSDYQFFFEDTKRIYRLFPYLFNRDIEADEGGSPGRLQRIYGWFATIEAISKRLNENWDNTAKRNVIDFLSKAQYYSIQAEEERERHEQELARHRR